jgi:hypothetical protein
MHELLVDTDTAAPSSDRHGSRADTATPSSDHHGSRADTATPSSDHHGSRPDTATPPSDHHGSRPDTATPPSDHHGSRPGATTGIRTEEDLYAEVTRAWCRMLSRERRRKRPLRRYVFGPDFALSVLTGGTTAYARQVASVCALLACRYPWPNAGAESSPQEHSPSEGLDPALTWWRPLESHDRLGLHYWELGNGTIEFISVGLRANHPTSIAHNRCREVKQGARHVTRGAQRRQPD